MGIVRLIQVVRPGCESDAELAWKHRIVSMTLVNITPWWQWRKRQRRYEAWKRAMNRWHRSCEWVPHTARSGTG